MFLREAQLRGSLIDGFIPFTLLGKSAVLFYASKATGQR